MSYTIEDAKKSALDGLFVSGGVAATAFISKKALGEGLGVQLNASALVKTAAAIVGGTILVDYAKKMNWIKQ